MSLSYLNKTGLTYFFNKIKEKFATKDEVKPSYITAYLDSNQHISKTTNRLLGLVKADVEGDYFSLDTKNRQVNVLKDCSVIIAGHCFVENSDGDNYIFLHIQKNTINLVGHLQQIINRMYTCCSVSAVATNLKAGDKIRMTIDYESGAGDPYVRGGRENTYLSITKL